MPARFYISVLCTLVTVSVVESNNVHLNKNSEGILKYVLKPKSFTPLGGQLPLKSSSEFRLKITVFYEAMCPYSVEFLSGQLVPAFKHYKDFIFLDLVPYGSTKEFYVDGVIQFQCEHGALECAAQLIHACAVHLLQNINNSKLLTFIECLVENKNQVKAFYKCTRDAAIYDYGVLQNCSNSEAGKDILSGFGNRTRGFNSELKNFPVVAFNGVFNSDDNEVAYNNLEKVICKIVPETCSL